MNIAAIIVAYHPDKRVIELVASSVKQFEQVFVIFNSEKTFSFDSDDKLHIKVNSENIGLSKALNQGVDLALKHLDAIDWCVFFDQDTLISPRFRLCLDSSIRSLESTSRVGIIGQNYVSAGGEKTAYSVTALTEYRKAIVTSGSAIPSFIFRQIGGFDENLFIEGIDTEFCYRASAAGFPTFVSPDIVMRHGAGQDEVHFLLGRPINVSGHSPERYYLQWKNFVYVERKFSASVFKTSINLFYSLGRNFIVICLFERQRFSKLKACVKGLIAGFKIQI